MIYTIGGPGEENGPCLGDCDHLGCKVMRSIVQEACRYCGKPLGYSRPYHSTVDRQALIHSACQIEAINEVIDVPRPRTRRPQPAKRKLARRE